VRASVHPSIGRHWPIAGLLVLSAFLIFFRLGRDYLWADEGDTAVFAASITKFGVPRAWDGVTFTDADFGAQLTSNFVMVGHPWAQYYAAAASFLLFGESAWAARAPFAAAALANIILVYLIVWRATKNRWTAASAATLLLCSLQFLVYARQSRHYSLSALLACLTIAQFFRLRSWPQTALFGALAILLFHAHPAGLAPLAAMGALTLVARPFAPYRRWFWRAAPIAAIGIAPWLWHTGAAMTVNTALTASPSVIAGRLLQFGIECASVTSLVGTAAIALFLAFTRRSGDAATPAAISSSVLAMLCAGTIVAYACLIAVTQSRAQIWEGGTRQASAVIPIAAMLAALAIAAVARNRRRVTLALVAVFALTKVPRLTPWTVWAAPSVEWTGQSAVAFHRPPRDADRWLRTGSIGFVRSLFTPNPGTVAGICEFLERRARPDDVILTNYEWEPLYFHTRLPQALKVLPTSPIYAAARERHLPDYVFFVDRVQWVIIRRAWKGYGGQDLERVLTELRAHNYRVTLATTIPETVWENRENVHFRRYPGGRYFYPWYDLLPDAEIYKVERPSVSYPEGSRR
jgi:4-amino-4-deoxy-L-arabinose transferase-like glycosyltransferase